MRRKVSSGCCLGFILALALWVVPCAAEHPLLVGGHAHAGQDIRILHDLGVGNFVWIPKYNVPEDGNIPWSKENDILAAVDACVSCDMSFMISQGRGLGLTVRPGGPEYGGDCSGLLHGAAVITEIKKRAGKLFAGLHAEELDADLVQCALRPSYRSRVPWLYDFTDRKGGRLHFEDALTQLKTVYQSYGPGIEYWPNLCITFHHSGFRVGADLVIAELLEHLPTTELQLAYLRGGARQFGGDWGIWVSPWYAGRIPCEDKTLWPASYAQPGGGHPASALRRCLYLSYASGSRVFTSQCVEPLFSRKDPNKPEDGYKLAPWGAELKSFWDYAKNHQEPMRPIVPVALLVDKNSGWAPGHLWGDWAEREMIWGKLPTDRADAMLSRYLDVLLPGYGRTKDSYKTLTEYPGYFASTPAGPFDIVSSDISAQKLGEYDAVALMADVDMSRELLNTLRAYVSGGGTLYVNVDQMRSREAFVQDPEMLGARIGESSFYVGWVGGHVPGRRIDPSNKIVRKLTLAGVTAEEFTEPSFCSQDVQPTTAEVVAADDAGRPVLLRNKFGKGTVYLSVPEYMMEGYGAQDTPLGFFRDMILGLRGQGPVNVTAAASDAPAQDVSWCAATQGEDVVVAAANHGKSAVDVDVTCRGKPGKATLDIGQGGIKRTDGGWRVTVQPEDVVLVRIGNTR